MTVPSAPRTVVGLDVDAVSSWIGTLGVGEHGPLRFDRIGQGKSNLTYLVTDAADRRWVLRRPPLGHLLASAHDVAREHRILSALQETAVPTPRVYGLCDDEAVSDVPLLLMEHVDGLVVDDLSIAEALSDERRRAIGLSLAATLARVHAVDLDRTGLTTLASHKPYAQRQLDRWQRQWEASRTRDLPAVDDLSRRLRAAMPAPGEITLVHGDFHLLNVITSPIDGSIRAILDWELCTLGDPLADVGGLLAYWPQSGDAAPAIFPAPALPGFPTRGDLARTYAEQSGRSLQDVGFWHVLGLWKIAIIVEGVLRRRQDDPRNADDGEQIPFSAVDDLVTRALATAKEVGL